MWLAREQHLGRALHFTVEASGLALPFATTLHLWQNDAAFREFFNATLAAAPYTAYRWETPPVTAATLHRPFEFVLLESPSLDRAPDPRTFAAHFGPGEVVTFPNLGGDAVLVVPCPCGLADAHVHLAKFVRNAPEAQRHALWAAVGAAMVRRVGDRPVWLSTSGAGVAWLHVRLDDAPKYYAHVPYRDFGA